MIQKEKIAALILSGYLGLYHLGFGIYFYKIFEINLFPLESPHVMISRLILFNIILPFVVGENLVKKYIKKNNPQNQKKLKSSSAALISLSVLNAFFLTVYWISNKGRLKLKQTFKQTNDGISVIKFMYWIITLTSLATAIVSFVLVGELDQV